MILKHLYSLLLLAALNGRASAGCPLHCACTSTAVTCAAQGLEDVPNFDSLAGSPLVVDLSGNRLALLDATALSFDASGQVKELYLNGSRLLSLEAQAFDELLGLQELHLQDNLLSDFGADLLQLNGELVLVDLSSNLLSAVPGIRSRSLEVLALARNSLETIAEDALAHLPSLRMLLLQENHLRVASPDAFARAPLLSFVQLEFNPWRCSCETARLLGAMLRRGLLETNGAVQCATEGEEKFFIKLYEDEALTEVALKLCARGNRTEKVVRIDGREMRKLNETDGVRVVLDLDQGAQLVSLVSLTVWGFTVGFGLGAYIVYVYMKSRVRKLKASQLLAFTS